MRLDKFLKVSRIIKRRTLSKEISQSERVKVNGKVAKPSTKLKVGDIIEIDIPLRSISVHLSDEELAARPMRPLQRKREVSKALRAYASMVSSADKGGVREID